MQSEYNINIFCAIAVKDLKKKQNEPLPQIFACKLLIKKLL